MPITRAAIKRKLAVEQPEDSPSQETVPETPPTPLKKRKAIASKKPREPPKKDARRALEPKPVEESTTYPTLYPERSTSPVPKRTLTNSKSKLGIVPGRLRGRDASRKFNAPHKTIASTARPHRPRALSPPEPHPQKDSGGIAGRRTRSRTRTPKPTPLPALGAALKEIWAANLSAGGSSFPPEWNGKAHYRDGHVFSDGTFVEDGQLCKPLVHEAPFRPVARPRSNFAAYEALFGGQGPSGLKDTRPATKRKDLLPPDLDAKLRASLGLDLRIADMTLSGTSSETAHRPARRQRDGLRRPATALDGVVARANKPNPFTEKIAAERTKRRLPTRPRAGAVSGNLPPASALGRKQRGESPLVGLFADTEIQVAKKRAGARAPSGEKENPFARVTGATGPKRPKPPPPPPPPPAVERWSGQKTREAKAYMRRQVFSKLRFGGVEALELGDGSPAEKALLRSERKLDPVLQSEEERAVGVERRERRGGLVRGRWGRGGGMGNGARGGRRVSGGLDRAGSRWEKMVQVEEDEEEEEEDEMEM
ncbi:hypothetical protein MMC17_001551 [Xylographa soralifera]|nr:hypothetical protein [Xylographa soralifera]